MKKQLIIYSVIGLFLPLLAAGQSLSVKWSDNYKLEKKQSYQNAKERFSFIAGDTSHYAFQIEQEENRVIRFHNYQHQLQDVKGAQIIGDKKALKWERTLATRQGKFVLSSHPNKGKLGVYATPIEQSKVGQSRVIYEHPLPSRSLIATEHGVDLNFEFRTSPQQTKVVYYNRTSSARRYKQDPFTIAVFDENMQLIWKRLFDKSLGEDIFSFQDFTVSDDGVVYMTAKIKNGGNGGDYWLFLLKITEDDIAIQEITLEKEQQVSSAGIVINEANQTIQLTGVYGDKFNENRMQGFFSMVLDADMKSLSTEISPIDEAILEKVTERERPILSIRLLSKSKELNANKFKVIRTNVAENGATRIVVHYNHIIRKSMGGQTIEHLFESYIVASFDTKGVLSSSHCLVRYAGNTPHILPPSKFLYRDGVSYLIYGCPNGLTDTYVDVAKIDEEGVLTENTIHNSIKHKGFHFVSFDAILTPDKLLVGGVNGRNLIKCHQFRIGVVEL